MSGASLNRIPRAPEEARRQVAAAIETPAQAQAEDHFRAARLREFAESREASAEEAPAAFNLAERIEPSGRRGDPPDPTLASKRWCRLYRIDFGAHLLPLVATSAKATMVSLIPTFGAVPAEYLYGFTPTRANARIRSAAKERGAREAGGTLLLVFECEVQVPANHYQGHYHGFATGKMIEVVDRLRDHPALRHTASVKGEPKPEVCNRVEIKREPLTNLPHLVTYPFKHWTARYTSPEGKRGPRIRIRGPEFARHLLWLDRHQPSDLILMMGMRMTSTGFALTGLHA